MNFLLHIKKTLDKSLQWLVIFSMGFLVLDVTLQVIISLIQKMSDSSQSNFLISMNNGIKSMVNTSQTSEIATFMMMWVGLLGASVALNRSAHLGIDYFIGKLNQRSQYYVTIFNYMCIATFSITVLICGGISLVKFILWSKQQTPALEIYKGYVYLCVPISGLFLSLYSFELVLECINKLNNKGEK